MKSECCGVEVLMDVADLELCPCCWEHCDVVFEDNDKDIENFKDGDVYDLDAFDGADPDDVDWSPEDEGG